MMTNSQQRIHRSVNSGQLVEIIDEGTFRSLYFGKRTLQSRNDKEAPHKLQLLYTRYMMSCLLLKEHPPKNVLLLGVGGGSLISFLHHHLPSCIIDGVDNSQQIIELARQYFNLPDSPEVTIHLEDGSQFLENLPTIKKYDLILIDAFNEHGMSAAVYTSHLLKLCRNRLTEDGIVTCNLWSGNSLFLKRVQQILQAVFPSNLFIPVAGRGNIVAHSMAGPIPWAKLTQSKQRIYELGSRYELDFEQMIDAAIKENCSNWKKVSLLTRKLAGKLYS